MRTVTLTFPMPLNLANTRLHWRRKAKRHLAWKMEAVAMERGLRGRVEPMRQVQATAVFYLGTGRAARRNDDDNATARLKWVFDLLKERGVIVDDRQPHLTLVGVPEQRIGSPRRVELTLTEAA